MNAFKATHPQIVWPFSGPRDNIGCRAYSDGDSASTGWRRDTVSCSVVKRLRAGQKVAFYKEAGGIYSGTTGNPETEFLGYFIR